MADCDYLHELRPTTEMTVCRPIRCVSLTERKYCKSSSDGKSSGPLVRVADDESDEKMASRKTMYLVEHGQVNEAGDGMSHY